ncbi:hypothetical protein PRABACTJOHN_01314 [Parabacteroides johnsonii DSM 18315]|uniref:Uncharacterized protein n=1 Tax=Parabacteroides johnsonii DSM 18315 TaxID=537006 RepID=B7B8G3_9BACT|nr:hypothetical protein PRABACTJOHN_01314 [Parabacteroides johnsonii DSM 18315]
MSKAFLRYYSGTKSFPFFKYIGVMETKCSRQLYISGVYSITAWTVVYYLCTGHWETPSCG